MRRDSPSSLPLILQYSLPVLLHDVLKRPEEVLLEAEVGQLSFLQELHGELPQRVHSKDGYILIRVTAHLEEDRHQTSSAMHRLAVRVPSNHSKCHKL